MNPLCEGRLLSSFTFTTLREEMLRLRDRLQSLIPALLNPTVLPLQLQCSFTSQGGEAAPGPREACSVPWWLSSKVNILTILDLCAHPYLSLTIPFLMESAQQYKHHRRVSDTI